ncbi:hypothetical protein [Sphingobium indicum]
MMDTATPRARAIALMREAITFLEATNHAQAILHLEQAIASATRPPFFDLHGLGGREAQERTYDPALGRAIGGALSVIGALLNKSGAVSIEEFAGALRSFAVVSGEDDYHEGTYLGCWAAMLREVADVGPQAGT